MLLGTLLAVSAAADAAPELDTVIAALAQPVPAHTPFFERRVSNLLVEPMLLQGSLRRPAADHLIKQIDGPPNETMQIAGDRVRVERDGERTRSFSLRRAPELAVLAASFDALLAGDRARLEQHYQLTFVADAADWQIDLVPLEKRVKKRVDRLRLTGTELQWRCFDLELSNGEKSRMWLGEAAAEAAAAADETARDALCRATAAAQ